MRHVARDIAARRSIRDMGETLRQIVVSAVDAVPHVDAASISLVREGRVETHHPTDDVVAKLDDAQNELHEGPCITAISDPPASGVVVANDFAGEEDSSRWPHFAPRAVGAGYRALVSTPLSTTDGPTAALNLYAADAKAFDERTCTVAALFGAQASVLLHGSDTASDLKRRMDQNDLIGRATGILMERFHVGDEEAFRMLRDSSRETNMKLLAVAEWVTAGVGAGRRPRTR